jgi:hypothetical protein
LRLPWLSARLTGHRILSTPRQRLHLIAEALDVVQRSGLVATLRLPLTGFARA